MKRMIAVLMMLAMLCGLLVGCGANVPPTETDPTNTQEEPVDTVMDPTTTQTEATTTEASVPLRIALISGDMLFGDDYTSSNAIYQAALSWSETNGVDLGYYRPETKDEAGDIEAIEKAIADGAELILTSHRYHVFALVKCALKYPDVKFIAMDMSESDLQEEADGNADFSNVFCCDFREEIAGFMAGYAAVQLGYTKLGFLGGLPSPLNMRYGYGFVQGADAAAGELGAEVVLKYTYAGGPKGDADTTAMMDDWYADGTQVVLACEGTWNSAAGAAMEVGGKVIGTISDMAPVIDGMYGAGMTLTSAMTEFYLRTYELLDAVAWKEGGNWDSYAGTSEVLSFPYLMLPETTQWNEGFTQQDYEALCQALADGTLTVYDETYHTPDVQYITVDYLVNVVG